MACARRRIRPIDRLVAAHITKIGLKSLFFSGLLGARPSNCLEAKVVACISLRHSKPPFTTRICGPIMRPVEPHSTALIDFLLLGQAPRAGSPTRLHYLRRVAEALPGDRQFPRVSPCPLATPAGAPCRRFPGTRAPQ